MGTTDHVNLVNVVAGLFGLATFDVKDMVLTGTVIIDGKTWTPVAGNFDIPLNEVEGKEVEIQSSPKSLMFTLNSSELDGYRIDGAE